jgi:hypothetical protein
MTIGNAVRKLERSGYKVERDGSHFVARKTGVLDLIEFLPNGSAEPENEICCLRVRRDADKDDMQSDYSAGSYYDSVAQAMRAAEWR